jgi:hypothetical protein
MSLSKVGKDLKKSMRLLYVHYCVVYAPEE